MAEEFLSVDSEPPPPKPINWSRIQRKPFIVFTNLHSLTEKRLSDQTFHLGINVFTAQFADIGRCAFGRTSFIKYLRANLIEIFEDFRIEKAGADRIVYKFLRMLREALRYTGNAKYDETLANNHRAFLSIEPTFSECSNYFRNKYYYCNKNDEADHGIFLLYEGEDEFKCENVLLDPAMEHYLRTDPDDPSQKLLSKLQLFTFLKKKLPDLGRPGQNIIFMDNSCMRYEGFEGKTGNDYRRGVLSGRRSGRYNARGVFLGGTKRRKYIRKSI